jgi:hypothetical protein
MKKKIVSIILAGVVLLSMFVFGGCQNILKQENDLNLLKPSVDYSGLPVEEQVQKRTEDRYGIVLHYLWEQKSEYFTKYTFIPENGEGGRDEFDVWAYTNAKGELVLQDNYQSILLLEDYETFLGNQFKNLFQVENIKVFVEFDNKYTPGETRYVGYSYWPINYPSDATIEKAIDEKIDLNAEIYVVCLSEPIPEKEEEILEQKAMALMDHYGIRGSFHFIFAHQKVFDKATRDNAFSFYHEYIYNVKENTQGFRFDLRQAPETQTTAPTTTTTTTASTTEINSTTKQSTTSVTNSTTTKASTTTETTKSTTAPATTKVVKPTTTKPNKPTTTKPTTTKPTTTKPTTTKPIVENTTIEIVEVGTTEIVENIR